uniref:Uncharacterized protein n=1 Tax=Bionectria ochroleuca TaxID=29856 RepID=A0A0B7K1M8_BIOOC
MWKQIGDELGVGWRAAEAMHWQLGERELERRANLTAGARGEEHTNHPYQARGKEQSEAGNTYVLTSNQFNAHSANGELRLNPR